MGKMVLTLFIAGHTSKSERAVRTLYKLFEDEADYELSVIDVLENPQAAENEKILATPTLVRQLPPPVRRIIGDLSDVQKVLVGLDLQEADAFLGAG